MVNIVRVIDISSAQEISVVDYPVKTFCWPFSRYYFFLITLILSCFSGILSARQNELDSLKRALLVANNDTAKAIIFCELGRISINDENLNDAFIYADKARKLSMGTPPFKRGLAKSLNTIGLVYLHQRKKDEALRYFYESLRLNKERKKIDDIIETYNNIGLIYSRHEDYPKALTTYFNAVKIYERNKLGNEDIANVLINIGGLYFHQKNFKDARKYDFEALALMKKIKSLKGEALCYNNIGILHQEENNTDSAIYYLNKCLNINKKLGIKNQIAFNYNNIGVIYHEKGDYQRAMENYNLAVETYQKDSSAIALILSNLGDIYRRIKDFKRSEEYLFQGLEIAKKRNDILNQRICYENLAQLFEDKKDFQNAMKYYKNYILTRDSVLRGNNQMAIEEIKAKFESDKKTNEIKLINSQKEIELNKLKYIKYGLLISIVLISIISLIWISNLQFRIRAKEIFQQNEIRKKISRDLHDEIGSGLTAISMIAEQTKMKIIGSAVNQMTEKVPAEEYAGILNKISERSRSVIEKLREMVWVTNPSNDNIDALVSYFRNYLVNLLDSLPIKYTLNLPEEPIEINIEADLSKNLIAIMKEAVNNIILHSNANHIIVSFFIDKKEDFILEITDNGTGFELNKISTNHHGISNMKKRAEECNCTFEMISEKNIGTKVIIRGNFT